MLCWQPDGAREGDFAVDGELTSGGFPPSLARRLVEDGREDPWGDWTRAEVCAKLADVPIVVWIRSRAWPDGDEVNVGGRRIRLVTHRVDDLVVSLGEVVPETD
ncbi:hypothetical protein [Knoellia subterranea]|uniref:Uncharacterized protein n=1 Tax=Knoellia subterranea KCTC 19937 TaxID=1385521 RepID=A0A0A0JIH3_9MICO|nr:hypothetical protein [Knoellia subterranea]KGN36928.1 hypothetical protein N803_16060 [Knoellia subterranea KCTC 19937]